VSRHGVRAPTNQDALADYTRSRIWPTWLVASDADLTPRGEELATLMGEYYRQQFAGLGLPASGACPPKNQAYVWADVDQRTRLTGNALLAGAFPRCGLFANHGDGAADLLFHPTRKDGICTIDKETARGEIMKRVGGDLGTPLRRWPYRDSVSQLQSVLDCCKPKLCQANDIARRCTLARARASIEDTKDGTGLTLHGPISIGSTASEVFLLEFAQSMPQQQVGWGRASTPDRLMPLLELHRLEFELMQRTPHLAKRQGSALASQVLETLRQTAEGKSDPMRPVPAEAKLVIYVGHDTNLANIGGMLGVHWKLRSYLQDETPPAGAMAFELLRDASGARFVRMSYVSQSLVQMRNATRLSLRNPPDRATIAPACANRQGVCPWKEFDAFVSGRLDSECTGKPR
jgi:4-phytase / acid phosphatase